MPLRRRREGCAGLTPRPRSCFRQNVSSPRPLPAPFFFPTTTMLSRASMLLVGRMRTAAAAASSTAGRGFAAQAAQAVTDDGFKKTPLYDMHVEAGGEFVWISEREREREGRGRRP